MSNGTPRRATRKTVWERKIRFDKRYISAAVILILFIGLIAAALIIGGGSAESACGAYHDDALVRINGAAIKVELPRDAAGFAKGLGGRPCILPDRGMLFAFSQPGQYAFWMKDMKFPIDILWLNTARQVVYEQADVQPSTYPGRYMNQQPAQYVLEIKANLSRALHIGPGTQVSF